MKAKDIMRTPVISAHPGEPLGMVVRRMIDNRIGGMPVVDSEGKVVGFISRAELFPAERTIPFSTVTAPKLFNRFIDMTNLPENYREAANLSASDVMAPEFVCVDAETPLSKVASLMMRQQLDRVGVLSEGRLAGVIARSDVMALMTEARRA
jgi:CBS domain-containing protein